MVLFWCCLGVVFGPCRCCLPRLGAPRRVHPCLPSFQPTPPPSRRARSKTAQAAAHALRAGARGVRHRPRDDDRTAVRVDEAIQSDVVEHAHAPQVRVLQRVPEGVGAVDQLLVRRTVRREAARDVDGHVAVRDEAGAGRERKVLDVVDGGARRVVGRAVAHVLQRRRRPRRGGAPVDREGGGGGVFCFRARQGRSKCVFWGGVSCGPVAELSTRTAAR